MLSQYQEVVKKVNIVEMLKASKVIRNNINRTNLTYYISLSHMLDAEVYVKHENHNPTGSFKIRGAINLVHNITPEMKENGIVVATKGNHGMAMAWAAQKTGLLCNIVVPIGSNPEAITTIKGLGAQIIMHGRDFYEAKAYCQELVENAGYYYVEQGNNANILNGTGTIMLEIFEDLPDVDVVLMPIGGGSGIASLITVIQAINPKLEIIGVEPENSNAFYQSWKKGQRVILDSADTFADGLAARSIFEVPYLIIKDKITDVVLVSENELMNAVKLALTRTHNLAEGAGAAGLAGAVKIKDRLAGKKVVIIMTGGNLDQQHLEKVLTRNLEM